MGSQSRLVLMKHLEILSIGVKNDNRCEKSSDQRDHCWARAQGDWCWFRGKNRRQYFRIRFASSHRDRSSECTDCGTPSDRGGKIVGMDRNQLCRLRFARLGSRAGKNWREHCARCADTPGIERGHRAPKRDIRKSSSGDTRWSCSSRRNEPRAW